MVEYAETREMPDAGRFTSVYKLLKKATSTFGRLVAFLMHIANDRHGGSSHCDNSTD